MRQTKAELLQERVQSLEYVVLMLLEATYGEARLRIWSLGEGMKREGG